MLKSLTTTLTLSLLAFFLTISIVFKPCFADMASTETFTTQSGRKIPMSLIRRFLESATESKLKEMIFEYDTASNSLFSFHRTIHLPDPSTHSRITINPNVIRYVEDDNGERFPKEFATPDDSEMFMSKSENGDTFFFDTQKSSSLVGAFGDALDLHSIDHSSQAVFINHYIPIKPSDVNTRTKPAQRRETCKRRFEFSVHVISDEFLCARYGQKDIPTFYMIEQFIQRSAQMFMDIACVDIRLMGVTSYCKRTWQFNFKQKQCDNPNPSEEKCRPALTRHIMHEMKHIPFAYEGDRDFILFISSLNDAGSLAGLAYKSRACAVKLSKVWINGLSRVAFYHEIGHLLGANHVREGIMQSNVLIHDGIQFSDKSHDEINHFIDKDSRSWCLRRKYSRKQSDLSADGWVKKSLKLPDSTWFLHLKFQSFSIAALSSDRKRDILFIFKEDFYTGTKWMGELFYGSVKNIWTTRFPGPEEIEYKSLGIGPSEHYYRYCLRFFTANQSGSKSVVLSYLTYISETQESIPLYRVGSVNINGDIDIHSWGNERSLDGPYPSVVDFEMNIGNIRKKQSVDLIYVKLIAEDDIEHHTEHYIWRQLVKYRIGFNMSATGIIQGGWSDEFTIQGAFDTAVSISASVMDVDGNGIPDLVLYVAEHPSNANRFGYTYFRVGKDLSSEGVVQGGWTDPKMVPGTDVYDNNERSMDVGMDLESGYPVLISSLPAKNREMVMSFSRKDLFKEVLTTAKKYSAIESVTGNCEICYDSMPNEIKKCQRKLSVCKSQIDKLLISQDVSSETISTISRMDTNDEMLVARNASIEESKIRYVDYLTKTTNRNGLNINSIYCIGFQYFLSQDVCNTIDAKSVYSKGLEITFNQYLSEEILKKDINSTSLFEDPLGTNGNGESIIVQAEIRGRKGKDPSLASIKNAERRVRERQQLPKFKDLHSSISGKKLLKTRRYWSKKRKVWVITFIFGSDVF